MQETLVLPLFGRSPGGEHGNLLQYSCLENPEDRGGWWATVHRIAKSWTRLKWLSTHHLHGIFFHSSDGKESAYNAGDPGLIPGLGRYPQEGNGNPLQYSYLQNRMDRKESGGLQSIRLQRVSHGWAHKHIQSLQWSQRGQCGQGIWFGVRTGKIENEVIELRRSWRGKTRYSFIDCITVVTFTLNELGSYHSSEVTRSDFGLEWYLPF